MFSRDRQQEYDVDDAHLDVTVRRLARRLAPDMDAPTKNAPLRKSRSSTLLLSAIFIIALAPSIVFTALALNDSQIERRLRLDSQRAIATLSALPTMLTDKDEAPGSTPTGPDPTPREAAILTTGEVESIDQEAQLKAANVLGDKSLLAPDIAEHPEAQLEVANAEQKSVLTPPATESTHSERLEVTESADGEHESAAQPDHLETQREAPEAADETPVTRAEPAHSERPLQATEAVDEKPGLTNEEREPVRQEAELDVAEDPEDEPKLASGEDDLDRADAELAVAGDLDEHASSSFDEGAEEPLVSRPEEAGRIQDLIAHGHKMIDVGYFAGARAYFKRAAEAGSGEAALALGATYDPHFIDETGVHGIRPELGQARTWYERAKALGAEEAETKLADLDRFEEGGKSAVPQRQSQIKSQPTKSSSLDSSRRGVEVKARSQPDTEVNASGNDKSTSEAWAEPYGAVNMRRAPLPTGEAMRVVRRGTKLRVRDHRGSWLQVTDPETGEIGWIYSKAVEVTGSVGPQSP